MQIIYSKCQCSYVHISQSVSCDDFLPHTHAHSHTRFSAARTSHARVRFAQSSIAHALARFTIFHFIKDFFGVEVFPNAFRDFDGKI